MDYSFEQTVRHENDSADRVKYHVLYGLAVVMGICAFLGLFQLFGELWMVGLLQLALCLPAAIFAFIYKESMLVEYDYAIYEDELRFDKILNLKKRKAILKIKMEQVQFIAPVSDSRYVDMKNKEGIKKYDLTLNEDKEHYFLYAERMGVKILLRFEPKMEFLKALRQYKPSMVRI